MLLFNNFINFGVSKFHHNACRNNKQNICNSLPNYQIARKPIEESTNRFPWIDEFEMRPDLKISASSVIDLLGPLLTEERIQRIESVCSKRTFDILPIVEHPYDFGNVAAVCRSADALGYGALHLIRSGTEERYKQSTRTSGGADKWLDTQLFSTSKECLTHAKKLGYQIVATHLRADSVPLDEIDWTKPTAILFGNELKGISSEALEMADYCTSIPMDGFVESFNISVAASLVLWEVRRIRCQRLGRHNDEFTENELEILKAVMFLRTKGVAHQVLTCLLRRPPPEWQQHRNKGNWRGKSFLENGKDVSGQRTQCHFWDGKVCWGEKVLFTGKKCRYHEAHLSDTCTLDVAKLKRVCINRGVEIPEEILMLRKDEGEEVLFVEESSSSVAFPLI